MELRKYTKYEKARVIGARSLQLEMGAPLLLKFDKKGFEKILYNPVEIAKMEFEKKIIPITIKRPMPQKA
ncbi:DNA-directed RNA polymerase subunit K [archaeon]|jgi:DNA-directed RNA polymerase subunit K|nr:DNA-directed RNA polymerase subunit K [archaeon]|tara:strand:- start:7483 stop:7692 length:210 start_codon:yes stop_codon:yes gene_type:complete